MSGPTPTRSLSAAPVVAAASRGGIGMTIVLALIALGLITWVLAGTPGIGAEVAKEPSTAVAAPVSIPTKATATPLPREPVSPAPSEPVPEPKPEEDDAAVPPVVEAVPPVVEAVPPVVPPVTKKGDGKKKAEDPDANEPVNYDIVDDPDAPIEVTGAEIDGVLRPFRPAASECGKSNGVPLGTDIGVKMLLASDGKLTNVQPTDRPAGDPAVQCILGLIKGAKLELGARSKVTSAFFNYSFKVY